MKSRALTDEEVRLPLKSTDLWADGQECGLDSEELDDIHRICVAEAIRRRDEIRSGKVRAINGRQVFDEVRRLVGR